ncbi:MAG: acyl carrier protein [Byssovorax sp.]
MKWTRETLRADLVALFDHHAQAETAVTEQSHLVADLGIDSLGVMEVIADIEDKFKISIPDEALREVDTIGDVAAAIEAKLALQGRLEG